MAELLHYKIATSARVSAGRSGEKGHHAGAHLVVPGGTVRGALAALWWLDGAARGGAAAFGRLFDHRLVVGQAVPTDAWLRSSSTRICKYRPEAGCWDFAWDLALAPVTTGAEPTCACCGGPTDTEPGWHRGEPGRNRGSGMVATTRTQLDDSGRAKDGSLFARDALPAGLRLDGRLLVLPGGPTDQDAETGLDWLDDQEIRIGGKRSTMGAGRITVTPEPEPPELPHRSEPDGAVTVLRLRSPALLVDAFGAPSFARSDLSDELTRVAEEPLDIQGWWPRSEQVTGWHARSALPKPTEWALAPGCTVQVAGLTPDGWRRLSLGIGLRTLEGYGELEILTPDVGPAVEVHPGLPEQSAAQRLVTAFVAGGHRDQLSSAQAAIRRVADERRKRWGADPERVTNDQLKAPWARGLDAASREALQAILTDESPDQNLMNELGGLISRLGRGGRR